MPVRISDGVRNCDVKFVYFKGLSGCNERQYHCPLPAEPPEVEIVEIFFEGSSVISEIDNSEMRYLENEILNLIEQEDY